MTPEEKYARLQAWIEGTLPEDEHRALEADLAITGESEDAHALQTLWHALGDLPDEEPPPDVRARFYTHLHAAMRPPLKERLGAWLNTWWPQQPMYQLAYSLALVVAGVALGFGLWSEGETRSQVAALEQDVSDLNTLVALSLLQQPTASERLKGVGWAGRLARADDGLVDALLNTLNYDGNVSVRLAAVDALTARAGHPRVQAELAAALQQQASPLVQIALIDLIVAAQAEEARSVLWHMTQNDTLAVEVRQRARAATQTL